MILLVVMASISYLPIGLLLYHSYIRMGWVDPDDAMELPALPFIVGWPVGLIIVMMCQLNTLMTSRAKKYKSKLKQNKRTES